MARFVADRVWIDLAVSASFLRPLQRRNRGPRALDSRLSLVEVCSSLATGGIAGFAGEHEASSLAFARFLVGD